MRPLLISNSGKPLYWWCKKEIANFVGNKEVTFISAATVYDANEYYKKAQKALAPVRIKLNHLILDKKPEDLIAKTDVLLVGGGNTYQLLSELQKYNLLGKVKQRVINGASYVGLSAGANITGPNILTTNDWNVMSSKHFEGLNLVPFNINPHYGAPQDKIMTSAEARDERIGEYLVFNKNPVIALEEQTFLKVEDDKIQVGGKGKARVFKTGKSSKEFKAGEDLQL